MTDTVNKMPDHNSTEAEILRAMIEVREGQVRIETKLENITRAQDTLGNMPVRVERIETRMEMTEKQQLTNRWLIGITLALLLGLLGIAASHITWH